MATKTKAETQMPLFEGHHVTDHRLNFAGNVELGGDVVREMSLGAEVRLEVVGHVISRGHKEVRDKEGNLVGTVSSSTLVVEGVGLLDGV
jgi:hypothetical protein